MTGSAESLTGCTEPPAPCAGRRRVAFLIPVAIVVALVAGLAGEATGVERRFTIAFANLTEEPGVLLEGTGFTGREVRESFALAARAYPVDLVFYDNHNDAHRALANAEDAIARKVDLYIQYFRDSAVNAEIARKLRGADIPVLAVNYPVPGAPLYTADNSAAGRVGGEALGRFGFGAWKGQPVVAVLIGPLGAQADRIPERAQGVVEGLKSHLPTATVTRIDTRGDPAQVATLLGRFLAANPGRKMLVAAMDDTTALAAKSVLEASGRLADGAIVSHGVDRSIHGGMSDHKEIDPSNRGSIVIGSVAFYLDRYGYDVLPLALQLLRGEPVPPRTATHHKLITAANVFIEYPPYDMQ